MDAKRALKRIWRDLSREWLVLVLLTGFAALFRFVALDTLPPGLYHDEAYNGLDALQILEGHTPLFFEANNGREPLFMYLLALSVGGWGRSPGALRLVSAVMGTLTVPAVYWLGRELFGRRVGAIAAILASTTVWTLNLSRVAFRAVAMPPLMAVSLALLWRALRLRRLSTMVWGGVVYGLAFYTYLATPFSAIALVFFFLYTLLRHNWHRHRRMSWLPGWALFGLVSLVVVTPLGLYLLGHWQGTLGRAAQVSVLNASVNGGDLWGTLLRHTWRTLRGFLYRGDFIPRHNVPLRAVFDPLVGLAFVAGIGISLARERRLPACGLALIWLGTMLMPTILAEDAPHMLRGAGVLPVLFLFPALALAELRRAVERTRVLSKNPVAGRTIGLALVGTVLALSSVRSVSAYAQHLRSEAVYYSFEAGATALAVEINRFLDNGWSGSGILTRPGPPTMGRRVYLAARLWRDWASVRYLSPASDGLVVLGDDEAVSTQVSGKSLASRPEEVLLVLWPFEDNGAALELLPRGQLISVQEGAQERGDLEDTSRLLYVSVRSQPLDEVPLNSDAVWENGIRLLGYRLGPTDDNTLLVDLYWQAMGRIEASYTVFCHVVGDGDLVGQHDGLPATGYYTTDQWRAGDTIRDRRVIPLSSPYDRNSCQVRVGWYLWETMEHLLLLDETGKPTSCTHVALN